jgi:S-adenosylmethionine:tRNA ribosyltransferase-isomerase
VTARALGGTPSAPLLTEDLAYALPPDRIAQRPSARRDGSRLLRLDRHDGRVAHREFREIPRELGRPSLLVVNDTRVFPARLVGQLATGGRVELLLIERLTSTGDAASDGPDRSRVGGVERWRCLGKPAKKLRVGAPLELGSIAGTVIAGADAAAGGLVVELRCEGGVRSAIEAQGRIPLPPYIRREDDGDDRERYQTIFAGPADGSVAAPTAGLHFSDEVVAALEAAGHALAAVTLHVGPGTFRPVRAATLAEHRMDGEWFRVGEQAAGVIASARRDGRRVVAVGTTVVRALESAAATTGAVEPTEGVTSLFVVPGHEFRAVDGLLTNFHLPRSTLLALVCAFAGRERVLAAYAEALRAGYRFYSYGDAMLIL